MSYKKLLLTLLVGIASYGCFLLVGAILVANTSAQTSYFTIVAKIHPIAACGGIALLILSALFIGGYKKINHCLSFHKISFRQGFFGLVIIALANLLVLWIGRYFSTSGEIAWSEIFSLPIRDLGLFMLAVAIVQPLYEELLFRGFLFQGFLDSGLNDWATVALTALLWAGFHQPHDPIMWGLGLLMGSVLGLARLKTGSSVTSYLMHILFICLQAANYGIVSH